MNDSEKKELKELVDAGAEEIGQLVKTLNDYCKLDEPNADQTQETIKALIGFTSILVTYFGMRFTIVDAQVAWEPVPGAKKGGSHKH